MEQFNASGKKVFLLYPHSVIRDDMLDLLIMAGFETYTLADEKRAKRMLGKFPDSILFINIDEGMKEKDWEVYIREIQDDPQTKNNRLGIMSYNQDQGLMHKYLMEIGLPCGYIQLKLGLQESTRIILGVLQANEARGRRNSIRAACDDDINASLNYRFDTTLYRGKILDISSSGIAAKFDKAPNFEANTVIRDVQLKLRGGLIMTDLIFMGQRSDDKHVQILLFSNITSDQKLIIHRYIKQCLQKYINSLRV